MRLEGNALIDAADNWLRVHSDHCRNCKRSKVGSCRVERAVARLLDFASAIEADDKKPNARGKVRK